MYNGIEFVTIEENISAFMVERDFLVSREYSISTSVGSAIKVEGWVSRDP
jgi:hypothetical protein